MTREDICKKAVDLSDTYNYLILNWATGVGKSKASLEITKKQCCSNILLLVAETPHKKNWQEEITKWAPDLLNSTTIECYASLKNLKDTSWDLIILDEGHHAASDIRLDSLEIIKTNRVIVLSATIPPIKEYLIETAFKNKFYKYTVTLQEAIDSGILPAPRIYLVPLRLPEAQTETIIEEWGDKNHRILKVVPFEERFKYLNRSKWPSMSLTLLCSPLQKYNYLNEKVEYFKQRFLRLRQEFLKNKWLQLGSQRKRLLADLKSSTLEELLKKGRK